MLKHSSIDKIYRRIGTGVIITSSLLGSSCSRTGEDSTPNDTPQITVSIPPLGYFARVIGGDSLKVNVLIEGSGDPETFQPGMGAMKELQRGGGLITTGLLPFETELSKKISKNNNGMVIYNAGEGVELMYGTHSHEDHDHETGEEHHEHEKETREADPHIWSSVKNARIIARNIRDAIAAQHPEHESYYNTRYETLDSTLQAIDIRLTDEIGGKGESFLIWHPSLSYFARDYGLRQIAISMENKETTSKALSKILKTTKEASPKAFFISEGSNPGAAEAISQQTGLTPTEVNFMDGDWEKHITIIEKALIK